MDETEGAGRGADEVAFFAFWACVCFRGGFDGGVSAAAEACATIHMSDPQHSTANRRKTREEEKATFTMRRYLGAGRSTFVEGFQAARAVGEGGDLKRFQYTQIHMGVPVRITLYAPDDATAEHAVTAAYARFAQLEQVMSDYRPTSELMRLCDRAGGYAPVPVSDDLFRVLDRAQTVAAQSDGAFDVTVGPFVALWRRARRTSALPTRAELREVAARVGWRKMRLDRFSRTVHLLVPGMRLDLGGIAKGYGCDEAQKALKQHSVTRALVEAGGDIVASGPPPGERGWRIVLANAAPRDPRAHAALTNEAISSSGDTEQFVTFAGRRYSHIVDARTGMGLTSRIAVTVWARDGMTSDSLSTAVSVLGPERGPRVAARWPGVRVFVRRVPGG